MQTATIDQLLSKDALEHLRAFKRDVVEALPGSVSEVVLFGSRARGDGHEDSDYDVAVLLTGKGSIDPRVSEVISILAFDHILEGFYIQPLSLSMERLKPVDSELVYRIRADGVVIE